MVHSKKKKKKKIFKKLVIARVCMCVYGFYLGFFSDPEENFQKKIILLL